MNFPPSSRRAAIALTVLLGSAIGGAQALAGGQPALVSPKAPQAIGPYVQAMFAGDTLYLSGQLPIDPATGKLAAGDIRVQTAQVLKNLSEVLAANGMSLGDTVMANVFLTNLADFAAMNEVYATFFLRPARATVEVKGLALGALIEISLIAVRPAR